MVAPRMWLDMTETLPFELFLLHLGNFFSSSANGRRFLRDGGEPLPPCMVVGGGFGGGFVYCGGANNKTIQKD